MPITVDCPECGRNLLVPDALLNRRVKCPNCGLTFTAAEPQQALPSPDAASPGFPVPPPPPQADYEEVPDDEPSGRQPRRRRDRPADDLTPHRGQLIQILGICALPLLMAMVIPGLIMGVVAWVLGNGDLKEMAAGRMDPSGEGETRAGRVCGMIAVIVGGVLALVPVVLFLIYLLIILCYFCCFAALFAGAAGGGVR